MAKDPSFDIVSEVDLQVFSDCVNLAVKEIGTRFDLKDSGSEIDLQKGEKKIIFKAQSNFQLDQVKDVLFQKLGKRDISSQSVKITKTENATQGTVRQTCELVCGIDMETAKAIVKDIKTAGLKVQAAIQDEQVRVTGKKKDDLQEVMALVRGGKYTIPLQFTNFKS